MKKEYIIREEAMTIPVLPKDQRIQFRNEDEAFVEGWRQALECLAFLPAEKVIDLDDAADAIEKLSMKLHGDEAAIAGMKREIERMVVAGKPRWIPVTERMPEDGFLVGKLIADSDGCIRIASRCAVITLSGGKTVYTDLIDLVSILAKDTPTTEWKDCTHITHWMPLPEPPKEEE